MAYKQQKAVVRYVIHEEVDCFDKADNMFVK